MVLQITLLADEFKKSTKGGLSTLNRQLAIQLAKVRNVKVCMLMPKATEEDKRDAKNHKIKIIETLECVGLEEPYWLGYPPEDFVTDIVIGHDVKLGWPGHVIRRLCGAKWIHVVHTNAEQVGLYRNCEGSISRGEDKQEIQMKLCEMADLVVTVGPKLKSSVPLGACSDDKVFNLTPGLFEEFVNEHKELNKKERFDILVFGRGDPEDLEVKGFQTAVDAFGKLTQEDKTYNLIIAGAREGSQDDLMAKLEIKPDCPKPYIKRYKDREELKKLFMNVDLVLMPSKTDGFGLAGLEALSAGVAILVSGNCGLAEVLEKIPHGSHCIVEPDDDWVKAIKKVRRKSIATRNEETRMLRDKYKEKFSWGTQCNGLVQLMKKMCQGVAQKSNAKMEGVKGSTAINVQNQVDGATPKTISKKRKSGDKSKPGNESGGATTKTASKKRKSGDKSKPGNEAGGVTGMSGAKEVDQSGTNEMSTAAEVAGATGITPSPNEDESQASDESMVEEVHGLPCDFGESQTLIFSHEIPATENTSCTT